MSEKKKITWKTIFRDAAIVCPIAWLAIPHIPPSFVHKAINAITTFLSFALVAVLLLCIIGCVMYLVALLR